MLKNQFAGLKNYCFIFFCKWFYIFCSFFHFAMVKSFLVSDTFAINLHALGGFSLFLLVTIPPCGILLS